MLKFYCTVNYTSIQIVYKLIDFTQKVNLIFKGNYQTHQQGAAVAQWLGRTTYK